MKRDGIGVAEASLPQCRELRERRNLEEIMIAH